MTTDCRVHKLVADITVVAGDSVLMVKYRDTTNYDGQEGWFLPDDYLAHLEHPDDGAKRILKDQAGLSPKEITLSHIESFGDGAWHLVFHYRAELGEIPLVQPGDNVVAAEWFPLSSLPPESEVAHHGWGLDVLQEMGLGKPE